MKKRSSIIKRVLTIIGIVIGVLVLLVYIGLPVGMGIVSVLPGRSGVGTAPNGATEVTLKTQDGVQLLSWYFPPQNGTVILLLHGAGGSRETMRPYAEMLTKHGYGVLAVDLRGHGRSEGKTNRLGWQGTPDVGAALAFLQARSEVRHIGGLGSSMGGEVLLGAASTYPAIEGILADGATRRCLDELLALEAERPLVHNFTPRVMYAAVQLISGEAPPQPPLLDSIRTASSTRFLLVAAGNNDLEVSFNQLFKETLGDRGALWVAAGADHTGAFALYPQEYEKRVVEFFDGLRGK